MIDVHCYHVPNCDFLSVIDNVTFRSSYLEWGKIVNSPQLIFTVKEILGFGFSEITGASLSQATFTYNDPNQTKEIQDFAYIGLRKNNIQIKRYPR